MGVTNFGLELIRLTFAMVQSSFNGDYSKFGGKLVSYNQTAGIEAPVFYVLKRDDGLFVITRGSMEMNDYVTDVEFMETTNEYGTYHAGFFNASMYVYKHAKPFIAEANTPVYFLGHSYGAACATVLETIAGHDFPDKDINCIAYAPVPAISDELNKTFASKIVSFVVNHDMVPTLSIPNVYERFKFLFALKFPRDKTITIVKTVLKGIDHYQKWSDDIYQSLIRSIPAIVNLLFDYHEKKSLGIRFIPGTTYHIYSKKQVVLSESIVDVRKKLNIMDIHLSSIRDHWPDVYQKGLDNIISL